MMLNVSEGKRLVCIFKHLCGLQERIEGCWTTDLYRSTMYLRRGALLLHGSPTWAGFNELYVLVPANCDITLGEYATPIIEGKAIEVTDYDGVWWDALRSLMPQLETEIQAVYDAKKKKEDEEKAIEQVREQALLDMATESILSLR